MTHTLTMRQPRNRADVLELVSSTKLRERLLTDLSYRDICGQVCVAIVARCSLDDALNAVGLGITRARRLVRGLNRLGIRAREIPKDSKLPNKAIVRVTRPQHYDHWLIKRGAVWTNPQRIGKHVDQPKANRFVEIIEIMRS
jgi:hypothetical protein